MKLFWCFCLFNFALQATSLHAQKIAVLHYNGGGDWYSNPTALPNLVSYCNTHLKTTINTKIAEVTPESSDLFDYPYINATGHGNILFNDTEVENLRLYLLSGGFLHIDDNYGMEKYVKREIVKLFPDKKLVEVGTDHPIFKGKYNFPKGLPKIHEHDGKQPRAMGIFEANRLVLLFTFECDLGDGWESPEVHNDPQEVREKALQMGANIINYAFLN
ncbi:DUF4159 domain-containing protein [Aquimarina agarilytica]|uniref:DUF4159 domain-containing protein n=1 Tax=Aquimarina agarilytica TaxID=1087449 RepID=UPI0002899AC6|nr:DUF4159 domain-containing protein [Aquimarina agarilytica]